MSGDRVVPMRGGREPVSRRTTPGFLGLQWRYEPPRHGGCPHLIGVRPEAPRAEVARIKVVTLPSHADEADLRVGALIWSDYDEGAAALMAAAMEQENDEHERNS